MRAGAAKWTAFATDQNRKAWAELAATSSEANPFHEAWYLLPALNHFDPAGTVRLLAVTAGQTLVGLVPLQSSLRYYNRPVPHLAAWTHSNAFLGAPLVKAGHEREFWRSVLAWVDHEGGASLFFHLAQVPLESPSIAALRAVCAADGRRCAIVHREERALLSSDLRAEAYLQASLSGKKRKELRRQAARLAEQGTLRFDRREDDIGLGAWIDDFLRMEAAGWKGKARSALASGPATEKLFRDALPGAAEAGKLQRLTLLLDDRPIAMLAQFLGRGGAYSFKTAFDERFARFSPGVLLQIENLALLERQDVPWCDSCAAADHPMIDHIWRERRAIGHLSVAIGGPVRRALFGQIANLEERCSARS